MKSDPHTRLWRVIVGLLTTLSLLPAFAQQAQPRIVAIGDVHGAYAEFTDILQRTGLIDENRRWSGGTATFVQTGDVMDRGAQVRSCLDLLMGLENQAAAAGGRVVTLLGNHEAMNVMGDVRYVTAAIYATFATDQSEEVRARAYRDYLKFVAATAGRLHTVAETDNEEMRKKWMDAHPPGFFEYRDAIGPKGKYGRWLRRSRAAVQIGDGLFVHGGLNPALKIRSVEELDSQVHSELDDFDALWQSLAEKKVIWGYMTLNEAFHRVTDEIQRIQEHGGSQDEDALERMQKLLSCQSWAAVSPEGPLWYRGLAQDPEEKLAAAVDEMLARLKARYIVEGHTVLSKSDITPRFENHVFLIDTGMLKEEYAGRASALEIKDGRFTAYYADGEPRSLKAPAGGKKGPGTEGRMSGGTAWK